MVGNVLKCLCLNVWWPSQKSLGLQANRTWIKAFVRAEGYFLTLYTAISVLNTRGCAKIILALLVSWQIQIDGYLGHDRGWWYQAIVSHYYEVIGRSEWEPYNSGYLEDSWELRLNSHWCYLQLWLRSYVDHRSLVITCPLNADYFDGREASILVMVLVLAQGGERTDASWSCLHHFSEYFFLALLHGLLPISLVWGERW